MVLWAGYTALAQPGLPPCWLEAQACKIHPHISQQHSESNHTHDYLFDLAKAVAALGLPIVWVPASVLIYLLFLSPFIKIDIDRILDKREWVNSPEPPPPRLSFSS